MIDTDDAQTLALRALAKHEAGLVLERLDAACEKRTGRAAEQEHWGVVSCVAAPQIREAERLMGLPLPADAAACYEACNGMVQTCGWHWWPLHDVALQFRLMNTVAYELRLGEPGWFAPVGSFSGDGTVRADAWHRGWIAIAQTHSELHASILCIDTAPGPAGQCGQLIEVPDPQVKLMRGEPLQPAHRVAIGLLAYFEHLALVLESEPMPDAVVHWLFDVHHRRLAADLVPLDHAAPQEPAALRELRHMQLARLANPHPFPLHTEPALDLCALLEPRAARAARREGHVRRKRTLRALRVQTGTENICFDYAVFGDQADADRWLQRWAHAHSSAFGFLIGWCGDGKTELLLRLVARLSRARRVDANAPVPLYVDIRRVAALAPEQVPRTLAELIGAELAHRGLPDARRTVLQAVSDGKCVLILDHAEAIAPDESAVWTWAQQLPPPSAGLARRAAHVLLACTQEWFESDAHLRATVIEFWQARVHNDEAVYMLGMPQAEQAEQRAWLRAAGFDLEADPAARAVWEAFGHGARSLPAGLKALRPLLKDPAARAPGDERLPLWCAVYAAWWRHAMPADLGLGANAFFDHAVMLEMTQVQCGSGTVSLDQHAGLIRFQWPDASAAQQVRLRMATRIALHLRPNPDGSFQFHDGARWLAKATVAALESGDLDSVVAGLLDGPQSVWAARTAVQAWFEAGHTQPSDRVRQWLCNPQAPRAAGALFQLGCAMAEAHARRLTLTSARPYTGCLPEAMAIALPVPLSQAKLTGADLRGADFAGLVFEDVDFSGADLSGASFRRCRLLRVRLDGARAEGANFDEAQLLDVHASGLNAASSRWLHAWWNRRWPDADLAMAQLSVPGVSPVTADNEYRTRPSAGPATHPLRRLVRSPDGRWLGAIGQFGTIGVWRADDLKAAWHVPLPKGPLADVLDLCFSHDSLHLFSSHADSSVRCWFVADGEPSAKPPRVDLHPTYQLMRAGDASHLIGLGESNMPAWIDDAPALQAGRGRPGWMGSNLVGAVVIRRDPQRTVFSVRGERHGGVFEVHDTATTYKRRKLAWGAHHAWRMAVGWNAALGHECLAVVEPDAVTVGDPDAETPLWRIERPQAVIHSAAYLQVARDAQKSGGRVPGNEPAYKSLEGYRNFDRTAQISDLVFSPDGRWLVCVGAGHPAFALDTHTGTEHLLQAEASAGAVAAAFADDDQSLILAGASLLRCPLPIA